MTIHRLPVVLSACLALFGCAPVAAPPQATSPAEAAGPEATVLLGSFHIVWNGKPHYLVTDSAGTTTELLLTEEQTRPLGGPLQLNGRRVRVSGERVDLPLDGLRVTSISLQP